MLLGAVLHIHTDHLNITTNNKTPYHIICWLNYVKQFNPYIHFIPGKDNNVADTLSWFDCLEELVLSKDKQAFILKDPVSKGMDILFSLNVFCICHLWQYKTQTLQTANGYLINKMKLTN